MCPCRAGKRKFNRVVRYSPGQHIYAKDPLKEKNTQYLKDEFIAGWEQIGKQAITYVE